MHPDSKELLLIFAIVLIIDTTHKINGYVLPLVANTLFVPISKYSFIKGKWCLHIGTKEVLSYIGKYKIQLFLNEVLSWVDLPVLSNKSKGQKHIIQSVSKIRRVMKVAANKIIGSKVILYRPG